MKKIIGTFLMSTAFLGYANMSNAADSGAKAAHKSAVDSAQADYKTARGKCNALSGNAKNVCVEEAKAGLKRGKADAEAKYKNTDKARSKARIAAAEADYDVAKAKCGGMSGNDKDVCVKQAKAAKTAAVADAKADKKVAAARTDAAEDKQDAAYKVEKEKCDALSGIAKDNCMNTAKSKYGK